MGTWSLARVSGRRGECAEGSARAGVCTPAGVGGGAASAASSSGGVRTSAYGGFCLLMLCTMAAQQAQHAPQHTMRPRRPKTGMPITHAG